MTGLPRHDPCGQYTSLNEHVPEVYDASDRVGTRPPDPYVIAPTESLSEMY